MLGRPGPSGLAKDPPAAQPQLSCPACCCLQASSTLRSASSFLLSPATTCASCSSVSSFVDITPSHLKNIVAVRFQGVLIQNLRVSPIAIQVPHTPGDKMPPSVDSTLLRVLYLNRIPGMQTISSCISDVRTRLEIWPSAWVRDPAINFLRKTSPCYFGLQIMSLSLEHVGGETLAAGKVGATAQSRKGSVGSPCPCGLSSGS